MAVTAVATVAVIAAVVANVAELPVWLCAGRRKAARARFVVVGQSGGRRGRFVEGMNCPGDAFALRGTAGTVKRDTMDFSFGSLAASFLVSGVGFILLSYGRKMERAPQVVAGLVLLVAPYFVPGVLPTLLMGVGVGALLYGALWYGL